MGKSGTSSKRASYTGELSEAIVVNWEDLETWVEDVAAVRAKKLRLLASHYRLDPASEDVWEKLATALAVHHVPGFALVAGGAPKRDGRPKIWHLVSYLQLRLAVAIICSNNKISEAEACRRLARRKPWMNHCTARALSRRLSEAKQIERIQQIYESFQQVYDGLSKIEEMTLISSVKSIFADFVESDLHPMPRL